MEAATRQLRRDLQHYHSQIKERVKHPDPKRAVEPTFGVGDYVLAARLHTRGPTRATKLLSTWTGPFMVVAFESDHLVTLKSILPPHDTFQRHTMMVKPYCDSKLNLTEHILLEASTADGGFHIDDVHAHAVVDRQPQLLATYKGVDGEHWVPLRDLVYCKPTVHMYFSYMNPATRKIWHELFDKCIADEKAGRPESESRARVPTAASNGRAKEEATRAAATPPPRRLPPPCSGA